MSANIQKKGIFTLAIWDVMPGNEDAFIKAWEDFANWTFKKILKFGNAFLLRDNANSSRFISFGPWDSEEQIVNWRDEAEFKKFIEKTKELCYSGKPNIMQVAAIAGD